MENEELPQYMRIAGSVAGRIAEGQFAEGEKLSGRSKLSSEYQVSPETIRKAVQLLRDMQVVMVKEQSGVYVRSAENAKRYLQMIGEKLELRRKKQKLRALLAQQEAVARQVSELRQHSGRSHAAHTGCRAAAELCLPRSAGLVGCGAEPRLAPFLAGNGRDRRRYPARRGHVHLTRPVRGAVWGRSGHFCGRPGGPGGCRPVFQENGSNMSPAGVCLPEGKGDTCGS